MYVNGNIEFKGIDKNRYLPVSYFSSPLERSQDTECPDDGGVFRGVLVVGQVKQSGGSWREHTPRLDESRFACSSNLFPSREGRIWGISSGEETEYVASSGVFRGVFVVGWGVGIGNGTPPSLNPTSFALGLNFSPLESGGEFVVATRIPLLTLSLFYSYLNYPEHVVQIVIYVVIPKPDNFYSVDHHLPFF